MEAARTTASGRAWRSTLRSRRRAGSIRRGGFKPPAVGRTLAGGSHWLLGLPGPQVRGPGAPGIGAWPGVLRRRGMTVDPWADVDVRGTAGLETRRYFLTPLAHAQG